MEIEKKIKDKFEQIKDYFVEEYNDADFEIGSELDEVGFVHIFCTEKSYTFIDQAIKCNFVSIGKAGETFNIAIKPKDLIEIGKYLEITGEPKVEKYINAINQKEDAVFVEFVEGKGYCLTFNTNQKNLHYIMKSLVDCYLLPFNNTITFSHSYERGINRDRFDIVFGIEEDFIKFCESYFSVRTLK